MPLFDEVKAAEWDAAMDARWLAQQTPAIEGWKAEDAAFASYCQQRDMGIKHEALARFYTPYWAGDFAKRYADEKFLQRVEAQ